jgi:hypothetical protein
MDDAPDACDIPEFPIFISMTLHAKSTPRHPDGNHGILSTRGRRYGDRMPRNRNKIVGDYPVHHKNYDQTSLKNSDEVSNLATLSLITPSRRTVLTSKSIPEVIPRDFHLSKPQPFLRAVSRAAKRSSCCPPLIILRLRGSVVH